MNKGISPVGINFRANKKTAGKIVKSSIDAYYDRELAHIKKQKLEKDVFQKLDPGFQMESTKNKIQITIENMLGKKE